MEASTPLRKPSLEAHNSPRGIADVVVLEHPEERVVKELEQVSLEGREQPPKKTRMQELEEKRLALRRQCAHLQQRLHEFSSKSITEDIKSKAELAPRKAGEPSFTVENVFWQDEQGNEATYSGPMNSHKVPHGPGGKMVYEDGSVLKGEFKDGKPHGQAKYVGADGFTFYEGGWVNGSKSGYGEERWRSGAEYTGNFLAGLRHGRGKYIWNTGETYDGEWEFNLRSGRGCHKFADGRQFAGQWSKGVIEGKGVFTWPDGSTYDGMTKNGLKHGHGTQTWPSGRTYTGEWRDGLQHSDNGVLTFPDGRKYRGQFRKGKMEGRGLKTWPDGSRMEGTWRNSLPVQGSRMFPDGTKYTGSFNKKGKYHGEGMMMFPSGKMFVGTWHSGYMHGEKCTFRWPSGKSYQGAYRKGEKHGYGTMTYPDKRVYKGGWKHNKRCGQGVELNPDGSVLHCGEWRDGKPVVVVSGSPRRQQVSGQVTEEANITIA